MTKPKFTPGPWRVDADGNHVVSETYHEICAGYGYLDENTGEGFSCTGHMSRADANLIAAAPDMYAALELCEHKITQYLQGQYQDGKGLSAALRCIIEILAKAGRQ